jgi:hypothetical protein
MTVGQLEISRNYRIGSVGRRESLPERRGDDRNAAKSIGINRFDKVFTFNLLTTGRIAPTTKDAIVVEEKLPGSRAETHRESTNRFGINMVVIDFLKRKTGQDVHIVNEDRLVREEILRSLFETRASVKKTVPLVGDEDFGIPAAGRDEVDDHVAKMVDIHHYAVSPISDKIQYIDFK